MTEIKTQNEQSYPLVNEDMESVIKDRLDETNNLKSIGSTYALTGQIGTSIPAMFSMYYKFIQNPSTVSVDTFKRMIDTDDTLGSGVDFLTTCLAARLGGYQNDDQEITVFINKALEEIDGGFYNFVKELLSATWAGFSVVEKVFGIDDDGKWVIKKAVTLPPSTILFETERTGELTWNGILQYQRGYNGGMGTNSFGNLYGFSTGSLISSQYRPDPLARLGDLAYPIRTGNQFTYMSLPIPVEKCVHYSFDAQGKMGNPYGRSLLRRAYKWWVQKDAYCQMMSVALDRKGTPLTIVYADPNASMLDPEAAVSGANQKGLRGRSIRADVAAAAAFKNIHNDSTIILPGKKGQHFETDFVPQNSNAQDFISAINLCNQSLLRSLLVPSLIFGNGDGSGSFALGQEHARTFDKILDGMLEGLKSTLLQQVIKQLLAFNFPEEKWKKAGLGSFGKRTLSQDEIQKEMEVLEKATTMGVVDINDLQDLNAIREKIGFEPRTKLIEKPDPVMDLDQDSENQSDAKEEKTEDTKEKDEKKMSAFMSWLNRMRKKSNE